MRFASAQFTAEIGDAGTMEFTGYASIFGNRDHHGHVVERGAFRDTIAERMPAKLIKVFRDHWDLAGVPVALEERERGLWVHARLDDTEVGRETYAQLQSGSLSHMSFGYDIQESRWGEDDDDRKTLYIERVRLWEVSPVAWPANELTNIEQIKAHREARGNPLPSPLAPMDLSSSMNHLRTAIDVLGGRSDLTDEEQAAVKDALGDLGRLTRTLSALPRARSSDGPGAADAQDDSPLAKSLARLRGELDTLRATAAA